MHPRVLKEFKNEIGQKYVTGSYKWPLILKTGLLTMHPLFNKRFKVDLEK